MVSQNGVQKCDVTQNRKRNGQMNCMVRGHVIPRFPNRCGARPPPIFFPLWNVRHVDGSRPASQPDEEGRKKEGGGGRPEE